MFISFSILDSSYLCPMCNAVYKKKKYYAAHYRTKHLHSTSTSTYTLTHQCTNCNKTFRSSAALSRHVTACTGQTLKKTISCVSCDKTFSNARSYTRHLLEHHSKNPPAHSCSTCSKTFSQKGNLRRHQKTCSSTLVPPVPNSAAPPPLPTPHYQPSSTPTMQTPPLQQPYCAPKPTSQTCTFLPTCMQDIPLPSSSPDLDLFTSDHLEDLGHINWEDWL